MNGISRRKIQIFSLIY